MTSSYFISNVDNLLLVPESSFSTKRKTKISISEKSFCPTLVLARHNFYVAYFAVVADHDLRDASKRPVIPRYIYEEARDRLVSDRV